MFSKSRKSSNVTQTDLLTVPTSGKATPSANGDSLTLGFRERTGALHFSGL